MRRTRTAPTERGWRNIATQLDTVIVASASAPPRPDNAIPVKGGWRWTVAPGVDVEVGTPSCKGVADPGGHSLPFRWRLGPAALWGSNLLELLDRWNLQHGSLMSVHLARDYCALAPPGAHPERPSPTNGACNHVLALIERQRVIWERAGAHVRYTRKGDDTAHLLRGDADSIQVALYHKTAAAEAAEGKVPLYAPAWTARGWPPGLTCGVCGDPAPPSIEAEMTSCDTSTYAVLPARRLSCPCGGRYSYTPVVRAEVRWPRRYLRGRAARDAEHAPSWTPGLLALRDLLLPWAPSALATAKRSRPKIERADPTLHGALAHHRALAIAHSRQAVALAHAHSTGELGLTLPHIALEGALRGERAALDALAQLHRELHVRALEVVSPALAGELRRWARRVSELLAAAASG